jgi:hypothetical protein
MKIRVAFVLLPLILLVSGCAKHPVSDLEKVDPAALASPSPAK